MVLVAATINVAPPAHAQDRAAVKILRTEVSPGLKPTIVEELFRNAAPRLVACARLWHPTRDTCEEPARVVTRPEDHDDRVRIRFRLVVAEESRSKGTAKASDARTMIAKDTFQTSEVEIAGVPLDPGCVADVVEAMSFPPLPASAPEIDIDVWMQATFSDADLASARNRVHQQLDRFCALLDPAAAAAPSAGVTRWFASSAEALRLEGAIDHRLEHVLNAVSFLKDRYLPALLWTAALEMGVAEPCKESNIWRKIRSSPCLAEGKPELDSQ